MDREERAASRFACDDAQRACFEAGIKLATVYHQFVGTPFRESTKDDLAHAIEKCIKVQPYVEDASVNIRASPGDKADQYDYASLAGEMIEAEVVIRVGSARVSARMGFDEDLGYPLMFIKSVERV
ncbi:MAG: dihydroneopterin aldolase family protein [Methanomethylophilus sp.]|jgi:hypothetical protein